jgi:hypothetical protein
MKVSPVRDEFLIDKVGMHTTSAISTSTVSSWLLESPEDALRGGEGEAKLAL